MKVVSVPILITVMKPNCLLCNSADETGGTLKQLTGLFLTDGRLHFTIASNSS